MSRRVALVLGSGGARGFSHIGVIQELVARGYEITAVSGTSMGALVGGFWAAGKLDEFCDWAGKLDYFSIIKLLDVSLSRPGVIRGDRLFACIRRFLSDCRIEELPVPYTAVATSLSTRKEVWFQRGDLVTAIRASCAIPSLFHPVQMQGQILVDGAVLNPLPMAPAVSAMADMVIAVDLLGAPMSEVSEELELEEESSMLEKVFSKWMSGHDKKTPEEKIYDSLSLMDVSNQSMEVMQEALSRYKMAGYLPDIHIKIPRNMCLFYEFHRFDELVACGRSMAVEALDRWESETLKEPVMLLEANTE